MASPSSVAQAPRVAKDHAMLDSSLQEHSLSSVLRPAPPSADWRTAAPSPWQNAMAAASKSRLVMLYGAADAAWPSSSGSVLDCEDESASSHSENVIKSNSSSGLLFF